MPRRTHTGSGLWVAPLSKTTLAWLGAIGTEHPWRTAWERAEGWAGVRGCQDAGLGLTWAQGHGAQLLLVPSKQRCPVQPGGQKQLPSWGWQVPPW